MYRTIKKIHEKPESYRSRFVKIWSIAITSVIAIIWGITLPGQFTNTSNDSDGSNLAVASDIETSVADKSPLEVFRDSFMNSINFARNRLSASVAESDFPVNQDSDPLNLETETARTEVLEVKMREDEYMDETVGGGESEDLDFLPNSKAELEFLP